MKRMFYKQKRKENIFHSMLPIKLISYRLDQSSDEKKKHQKPFEYTYTRSHFIWNLILERSVLIIRKAFHSLMQSIKLQNNRYAGRLSFAIDTNSCDSELAMNFLCCSPSFYYCRVGRIEGVDGRGWRWKWWMCKICKLIVHERRPDIK